MTFHFRNWPIGLDETHRAPAQTRPRLAARWQRGPDGRLTCRWERMPVVSG